MRTDHQSLTGIRQKSDLPPRINRFLDIIEHSDPEIVYRKGSLNHLPDWLSRPSKPQESSTAPTKVRLLTISENENIAWNDIIKISEYLFNNDNDILHDNEKHFARHNFATFDGKLFKRIGNKLLVIENDVMILDIANETHQKLGHCSAATIKHKLERTYWHPALILISQEAIRRCLNCSLRRSQTTIGQSLEPLPPTSPFARLDLAFTGPVNTTKERKHILNAIDYATSWAYSISTANASAQNVIDMLTLIIIIH